MIRRILQSPCVRIQPLQSHSLKYFYHDRVVEYFENPPNVGSLKRKDKNVGTGIVGSIACGDQLKFQVQVGNDGKIERAVFKVKKLTKKGIRLWIRYRIQCICYRAGKRSYC